MEAITQFELCQKTHSLADAPRHDLLFDGKPTGFVTEASDIVAQYRVGGHYLLATVLENSRKEKLECYLLDSQFKIRSYRKYTGWLTTAFMVTGQRVLSGQSLEITLNRTIHIQLSLEKTIWPWSLWRPLRLELKPIL